MRRLQAAFPLLVATHRWWMSKYSWAKQPACLLVNGTFLLGCSPLQSLAPRGFWRHSLELGELINPFPYKSIEHLLKSLSTNLLQKSRLGFPKGFKHSMLAYFQWDLGPFENHSHEAWLRNGQASTELLGRWPNTGPLFSPNWKRIPILWALRNNCPIRGTD